MSVIHELPSLYKIRHLILIALSFIISPFLNASFTEKIDALLETAQRPFNGVILIAKGSEPIYLKATGTQGSPQIDSQFIIGSISKQITTVAILKAAEKGMLDLNKSILTYLPQLKDEWAKRVTLHHLLNHTSGIEAKGKPLSFNPGEKFAYCNLGYDLLGEFLATVTQRPYKEIIQDLFKSAGMTSSAVPDSGTIADLQKQYPKLLTGFMESDAGKTSVVETPRDAASNPSGGLISTAQDLLQWNLALHGAKLLSPAMYEKMMTPSVERENRWGKIGYGYGVHISQANGIHEISHGGIIEGYLSTLLYYPKQIVTVILLENTVLWPKTWDEESKKRIFHFHDQVRSVVRNSALIQ
jgi:CubicO group peptidase (beta-lactamase class C family)